MPKYMATDTAFVAEKARFLKKRSGSIGSGVRDSHQQKATTRIAPITIEAMHLARAPAVRVRAHDAEHEPEEAEAAEQEADEIEALVRARRLAQLAPRRAGS